MKIYFIRHGQTTANSSGTHQGWGPISLSELGFSQARAAHEYVGKIEFAKYYGSDLLRTRQTAELIFPEKFRAGEIIFDENLREFDTGAYYGKSSEEMHARFGDEYYRRRHVMDVGIYGMESSEHLKSRVARFMRRLEGDLDAFENERIAVVAHGGIIRTLTLLTSGVDATDLPAGAMRIVFDNCSVSIFNLDRERGWSIDALNLRPDKLS